MTLNQSNNQVNHQENLGVFRAKIDEIDSQILELLKQRQNVVKQVGEYKKVNSVSPLQTNREEEMLKSLSNQAEILELNKDMILQIWRIILDFSVKMQKDL